MVIFGHYCSFEQLQVIWFLEIILHMPLEMPHTYTSPDVQNQIIDILGDCVRQKILSKV